MSHSRALPAAYRLDSREQRESYVPRQPRCVFFEVTNRCNLACATCVRAFTSFEAVHDLTMDEFVVMVEQFPEMERAVLHGLGEPLLNSQLPAMIRHLKARGVHVLFNSNGTLLTRKWRNELISSGLDELRISLDTPDPEVYAQIRGRPLFSQVVENVRALVSAQTRLRAQSPRVSIWSVANRATLRQLPALIRLAASIGVHEVYIQRLTFAVQREQRYGMATPEHAVFGTLSTGEMCILQECAKLANELGVDLEASGATTPAGSLRAECDSEHRPWWSCLRPWTTTYVTANGNVLPCCMAHWADTNYESLMLGSIWERPFAEIWNDAPYQAWREALLGDHPSRACSGCGVFWSL